MTGRKLSLSDQRTLFTPWFLQGRLERSNDDTHWQVDAKKGLANES